MSNADDAIREPLVPIPWEDVPGDLQWWTEQGWDVYGPDQLGEQGLHRVHQYFRPRNACQRVLYGNLGGTGL